MTDFSLLACSILIILGIPGLMNPKKPKWFYLTFDNCCETARNCDCLELTKNFHYKRNP